MLVRWNIERHTDFVLFVGMPADMQKQLLLQLPSVCGDDAYAWYLVFLTEVRELYDSSVWSHRDAVRPIETVSRTPSSIFAPIRETENITYRVVGYPEIRSQISRNSTRLRGM